MSDKVDKKKLNSGAKAFVPSVCFMFEFFGIQVSQFVS
jgi:hypothetical protein